MNGYAQRAKYNFYLRRGFQYQNKNELEHAISNFKQAIRVAANETNEWETIFRDDILIAAEYETRAEYRVLMEDDDLDGAIKLLNDRIETIQDVEIQNSIDKEVILDRLRADIQKIKSDQNIQRQQYRLAIENIEEYIKIYSRTQDNDDKTWAITRKNKINAFITEREGDFSQAARLHEELANRLKKGKVHQFHEIQGIVCEIKDAILQGDLQLARERMDDIRNMVGNLRYETQQLSILIALIMDYRNNDLTDIQKVYRNISSSEEDHTKEPLQYEYDYASAVTVLLAAQRLRQYKMDKNLLDRVVKISLEDAFRSAKLEGLIEDIGLKKINTEQWVYHLPTHILVNIERISMRESAGTGDFSDVTMKLLATLEQYLEILAEYYGKQEWGGEWKVNLSHENKDRLSLGDLCNLFNSTAVSDFDWSEQIHEVIHSRKFANRDLVDLRNSLDHGRVSEITENQYKEIKQTIIDIIKTTARDTPVAFSPRENKNIFGSYPVKLHWGAPRNMVWLTTDADLAVDNYYFLPPQTPAIPSEVERWDVNSNLIIKCTGERTLENI